MTEPDFKGYATRSNVKCSDGRTILADAFAHQDGETVPLVWSHGHDEVTNVLGHAKLRNVNDGVRIEAFFNQTAEGKHAKEAVRHGDVRWLSIFANQLVEKSRSVAHGIIREVSLVLAGANPGANIDQVAITHSDGEVQVFEDEAHITTGLDIELVHSDKDEETQTQTEITHAEGDDNEEETLQDVLDTLNEKQTDAVNFLLSQALTVDSAVKHDGTEADNTDPDPEDDDKEKDTEPETGTDASVEEGTETGTEESTETGTEESTETETETGAETGTESGTDEDKDVETDPESDSETETGTESGSEVGDDAVKHDNITQEDNSMTHNLFDQSRSGGTLAHDQIRLSQDQVRDIIQHADEVGSLKKAMKAYVKNTGVTVGGTLSHGIENIDYLFPDAKVLENAPQFVQRRMEWVDKVLSGVRKVPFSRIKTVTADITPDEARARGYIKGNMKNEEFFELSKRETTPQTVYKKQKLDRDDVIDIVDLDVVAWMKAEMKVMLDEEIAGAILIGDGRSAGDEDRINPVHIRPIAFDAELYVTRVNVNLDDANSNVDEFVDAMIESRQYYKGTGAPSFYTTENIVAKFLTVKDNFGRRIYNTLDDVKSVLRVKEIVTVEVMDRVPDVIGIMVNLTDYSIGTDRGGQATMFDDFDIDYNKLRYLIETRLSGALTLPKSAIVYRKVAGTDVLRTPTEPAFNDSTGVLTVPTITGVVYKDGAGTTLTTGSPVTVAAGESIDVVATPAAGSYFKDNVNDQWTFTRLQA